MINSSNHGGNVKKLIISLKELDDLTDGFTITKMLDGEMVEVQLEGGA